MASRRNFYIKDDDWQRIVEVAKARKISPSEAIRSVFGRIYKRMKSKGEI